MVRRKSFKEVMVMVIVMMVIILYSITKLPSVRIVSEIKGGKECCANCYLAKTHPCEGRFMFEPEAQSDR
jgi:hypothetical protein